MPDTNISFIESIKERTKVDFKNLHWEGSFQDYMELAHQQPHIIRASTT